MRHQQRRLSYLPRTLGQEFHAYGNSVASDIDALSNAVNRCHTWRMVGDGNLETPHSFIRKRAPVPL